MPYDIEVTRRFALAMLHVWGLTKHDAKMVLRIAKKRSRLTSGMLTVEVSCRPTFLIRRTRLNRYVLAKPDSDTAKP